MAEKYRPNSETKSDQESLPSKMLKLGGGVLALVLGIDILRHL